MIYSNFIRLKIARHYLFKWNKSRKIESQFNLIIFESAQSGNSAKKMMGGLHDETTDTLMAPTHSGKTLKNAVTLAEMEADPILSPNSSHSPSFGALLKLALSAILPSLKFMFLLLICYIATGFLIAKSYSYIGDKPKLMIRNIQCIYYSLIPTIFIGMVPTIITCK